MSADSAVAFTPRPNRDAWATISAYLYQVDVTVRRWLDLSPKEQLELECGEDIDLVLQEIPKDDLSRVLEQVRKAPRALTLKSPSALQALVSFREHLTSNREIKIRFRYLTNAKVGHEYKSPMPDGAPAIEVWEQVRNGSISREKIVVALAALRQVLANAQKPSKVGLTSWQGFQQFVSQARDDDLLAYVQSFEWSTEAGDRRSVKRSILDDLVNRGYAPTGENGERLYDRLFLHVLKCLGAPGPKVLGFDALQGLVSRTGIEPADQQLMGMVATLLKLVEDKIGRIESAPVTEERIREAVTAGLRSAGHAAGVDAKLSYSAAFFPLDVPPIVERHANRQRTVGRLARCLEGTTWLSIHGPTSSGKTQLAILVTRAFQRAFYVSLGQTEYALCCARLDAALQMAFGVRASREFRRWYSDACRSIGRGALLVLDDLPRMSGNGPLETRLMLLVEACAAHGLRLLSTSAYPMPLQLAASAGSKVASEEVPLFDDREIIELLLAYDAPQRILTPKFISFVLALAGRQPLFLAALTRYLMSVGWRLEQHVIESLFKQVFAEGVKTQAQLLLKNTIPDPKTRELLYRVNLSGSEFTEDVVACLGEISPAIDLPLERFRDAVGLWIQREGGSVYRVSPVLTNLGSLDLPTELRRRIHSLLGNRIVEKRRLDPLDVIRGFTHFYESKEFDKAAVLLLTALQGLSARQPPADDWGLSSIWASNPLPEDISLSIRLFLRAQQISVRRKLAKEFRYLLDDFEALFVSATGADGLGIVSGGLITAISMAQEEPTRANRYLIKVVRTLDALPSTDPLLADFPNYKEQTSSLFWLSASAIRSASELEQWFEALELLGSGQVEAVFQCDQAPEGCVNLCDKVWLAEDSKPAGARDWDVVLETLKKLESRAVRLGLSLLRTCSIRSQIVVLSEYKKQLHQANELALNTLQRIDGDIPAQFLINEALGRQFAYAADWKEAISFLQGALDLKTPLFPFLRVRALMTAAQAASELDREVAIRYCEAAVEFAREDEQLAEGQLLEALGEAGLVYWFAGDRKSAFRNWEEGVNRLLNTKVESDRWKLLFMLYGNIGAYFGFSGLTGKSPTATVAASTTIVAAPRPGHFLAYYPQICQMYDPGREWSLIAALAFLADAVGEDTAAGKWALRALEAAQGTPGAEVSLPLRRYAMTQAIVDEEYLDALDMALDTAAAAVGPPGITSAGADADANALTSGLVPVLFRLATSWLHDKNDCRTIAASIADKCHKTAQVSVRRELWNTAANLTCEIFSESASWESLLEKGNSLAGAPREGLWLICYLGVILHSGPEAALNVQFATLPSLEAGLKLFGIYRRIVAPFVHAYWQSSVELKAFCFRAPTRTKERVTQLVDEPAEVSVKKLLSELASNLGVTVHKPTREWLSVTP